MHAHTPLDTPAGCDAFNVLYMDRMHGLKLHLPLGEFLFALLGSHKLQLQVPCMLLRLVEREHRGDVRCIYSRLLDTQTTQRCHLYVIDSVFGYGLEHQHEYSTYVMNMMRIIG